MIELLNMVKVSIARSRVDFAHMFTLVRLKQQLPRKLPANMGYEILFEMEHNVARLLEKQVKEMPTSNRFQLLVGEE